MDVVNRGDFEEMLAKALGGAFAKERRKLVELLGNPPRIENVPPEFWDDGGKNLRSAVEPILEKIYLSQAEAVIPTFTIGVDWALVNTGAIEWAQQYSFDLIRGLTDTTRLGVQTAIESFYQQPTTLQQLIDKLSPYFGPVRAEMIAITEVTRASVMGEDGVVNQILKDNPGMERVDRWYTYADDRVCEICGPMHNITTTKYDEKNGSVWIHPEMGTDISIPAHPRCRCWKRTTFKVQDD